MYDKNKNRRQYFRYDAESLLLNIKQADVKRKTRKSDKTYALDFNHLGMSFSSRFSYDVFDDLEFKCTGNKRHISGIIGFICNINEFEGKYRYGVQFDYSYNEYMRSRDVKNTLINIEHALKKTDMPHSLNRNAYRRIKSNR